MNSGVISQGLSDAQYFTFIKDIIDRFGNHLKLYDAHFLSDTLTDSTTSIPNSQLRKAVILIEQGRIDARTILTQDSVIKILQVQITAKQNQLNAYLKREITYKTLIDKYKQSETIKDNAAVIGTKYQNALKSQLKRSRTNTVLVGIAGVIVSGLVLYVTTK